MNRMKKYKQFFIWQWDEEERWLNEMAAQGWHFVKYRFPGYYTFEQGEPGAYQYRLEAMEHRIGSKEAQDYIAFLRDMDIEVMDSYLFWAYFRKPANGKPFEIFSDVNSKLKHMKRFALIPFACLMLLVINLIWGGPVLVGQGGAFGLVLVLLELALAFLLLCGLEQMMVKYRELTKQQKIHE